MFRRRVPTFSTSLQIAAVVSMRHGGTKEPGVFSNKGKTTKVDPSGPSPKSNMSVAPGGDKAKEVVRTGSYNYYPESGRTFGMKATSIHNEKPFGELVFPRQSVPRGDKGPNESYGDQSWEAADKDKVDFRKDHDSGVKFELEDDILGSKVDEQWPYDPEAEKNPIPNATGKDNYPGVYTKKREPAWFEKGKYDPANIETHSDKENKKVGYKWRADNINTPEYKTILGDYETRPPGVPGVAGLKSFDDPPRTEKGNMNTVEWTDIHGHSPDKDHHPFYDYTNKTGKFEGMARGDNHLMNWDIRKSIMSLYKACLTGLPMVKQYYWLKLGLDEMAVRVKNRFLMNKHIKDNETIRALLMYGWTTYQDMIVFRMQRAGVSYIFHDTDTFMKHNQILSEHEERLYEEKAWWQGAEQRAEGPYEGGQWSDTGVFHAKFRKELAGRVPQSEVTSKGYFDPYIHDGTNFWEKNLDYEGWAEGTIDPDRANQRRERANVVAATYLKPKHTVSKLRRQYRRKVIDYQNMMNNPMIETYSSKREIKFQQYMKEGREESNRLYAEKKLAMEDDDMFTKNWELIEPMWKQVYREFPNPRLWRTDAFFARLNFLLAPVMEYNWAKAPIGLQQEKLFNEWESNTVNYAVHNSDAFATIKACKKRNPMAQTPAEFYAAFDPDVPETRRLPWFHKDFNFDRRRKWDEWCMRQKKWAASGDLDSKRGHFEAEFDHNVEQVNRVDLGFAPDAAGHGVKQLTAARKAQLYRALIRRNDIALANQMVAALKKANPTMDKMDVKQIQDLAAKHDWSQFKFQVPITIYPDGWEQPALNLDGTPVDGVSTGTPPAADSGSAPEPETSSEPEEAAEATA